MTRFRKIKPVGHYCKIKPSMYRAMVNGDKAEFDRCNAEIIKLYMLANSVEV